MLAMRSSALRQPSISARWEQDGVVTVVPVEAWLREAGARPPRDSGGKGHARFIPTVPGLACGAQGGAQTPQTGAGDSKGIRSPTQDKPVLGRARNMTKSNSRRQLASCVTSGGQSTLHMSTSANVRNQSIIRRKGQQRYRFSVCPNKSLSVWGCNIGARCAG